MNAEELIEQVRSLGGTIVADGDRVTVKAPKGVIGPELRDALSSHKQAIAQHLHYSIAPIVVQQDGWMRVGTGDHLRIVDLLPYAPLTLAACTASVAAITGVWFLNNVLGQDAPDDYRRRTHDKS